MKRLCIAMFTGLLLFVFCQPVPLTGRKQLQLIPHSEMLQLSDTSFNVVVKHYDSISGTPASLMVKNVGTNIQSSVQQYLQQQGNEIKRIAGFNWQYVLLDTNAVNAFAMPGGEVGVFKGMIPVALNDTGLAVVMGHEIAHAVAGHGNERMSQLLLVQLGGMALQEALKTYPQQTVDLALVAFGVSTQLGVLLPYSRTMETEADHLGLIFMAIAGYDPHAAIPFWDRMEKYAGGGNTPEFLSTHPSYKTRMKNIEEFIPEAMKYYKPQ